METKNASDARAERPLQINRTAFLYGVTGLWFLALGGLPALDRVWAHLGTVYWGHYAAREVLSLMAGTALMAVAVVAHRRARQAAQAADAR